MLKRLRFVAALLVLCSALSVCASAECSTPVPILMYHHIADDYASRDTVSPAMFESHLAALTAAGYHSVSIAQLILYVDEGEPLPDKPIVISFDDGYASNLEYAAPLLQKYGMCAIINIIGTSDFGSENALPHFSVFDALSWIDAGVLELGSHTYNMHQSAVEEDGLRAGAAPMTGESDSEFYAAFSADNRLMTELFAENGLTLYSFAYPYGYASVQAEQTLASAGVPVTMTTREGVSVVRQGAADSLRLLRRIRVSPEDSPAELLARVGVLSAAARLAEQSEPVTAAQIVCAGYAMS